MCNESRTTTWRNLDYVRMCNRTMQRTTPIQRDKQHHHNAHETRHLSSVCTKSSSHSCCCHLHSLRRTSRGVNLSACLSHVIHACSERHSSTLSSPFRPTSSSLCFSINLYQFLLPSTSTKIRINTAYSATRRWGLRTNRIPAQIYESNN